MGFFSGLSGAISLGSAVVGAVSSFKSADAAEESARAQSQAANLARKQQAIQASRSRREVIRSRRIAAAANQARGVATGTVGSSTLAGVQGALNTNFASNLAFLDTNMALATQRANFLDQAQINQAQASIFGAKASLAFAGAATAFNLFEGSKEHVQLSKVLRGT